MSEERAARVRQDGAEVAQLHVTLAAASGLLSSDQGFDALTGHFLAGMLDGIAGMIEDRCLEAESAALRQIADDLAAPDAEPIDAERALL